MKKLLLLVLVFQVFLATGQQVNQCGIIIPPQSAVPRSNFTSVNEAATVIRNILNAINWRENFAIREQNGINNAYATILNGRRVIIYDNAFLTNLDAYTGTRWASISVLAHEMGHHYFNHIVSGTGSTPQNELQADYFSGYVLQKIGATQQEASAAMQAVSPAVASRTHPGRSDRVNSIQQGWNYAIGTTGTPTTAATRNPAPQPQQNPPPPASSSNWIQLSQYSNQDMVVHLSDDGRRYNPAVIKPTQPFVFKYEVYNYGWMRLTQSGPVYKLVHGRNYSVIWNQRTRNWTVVEVK